MATEPTTTGERFMASAHAASETGYRQRILGGHDEGPPPSAILLASLASCTAITLTMYAERKSWLLGEVKVDLALFRRAARQAARHRRDDLATRATRYASGEAEA